MVTGTSLSPKHYGVRTSGAIRRHAGRSGRRSTSAKRRASAVVTDSDRDAKRLRPDPDQDEATTAADL